MSKIVALKLFAKPAELRAIGCAIRIAQGLCCKPTGQNNSQMYQALIGGLSALNAAEHLADSSEYYTRLDKVAFDDPLCNEAFGIGYDMSRKPFARRFDALQVGV